LLKYILLGGAMMIATTAIHAGCTMVVISTYRALHVERWGEISRAPKVFILSGYVLLFFLASLLEIWLWAGMYRLLGALSDLEEALYFSTVTFTTLGYGDVVLQSSWRLLASFQAVNGIIMFGWTTAVIVALVQRILVHESSAAETKE
jgi:hypothetical protein